ncbi:MerR family transcriptional regulator [Morganella morganii]|uniref:MerR family transcriptional regulator n=1 Tax=bacterium 19GA11TI05 TaxID=2920688 RepID=A0AAU6TY25_UNCXX|nr:TipAS antibiotic-recognition domain-containing protein [Morganella morganii]MDW7792685.1 TipAS antibiotic-recognition domain-containing protein [Morganella morganii]
MLLQVGEIAEKTGLTVRTLHHYEEIGLLQPVSRTGAGYRLYNADSIERLTRIQILRQIGVKLKDIGKILGGHDGDMANLLKERVSVLTAQMQEMAALRYRLDTLCQQMHAGEMLSLNDCFSVLEMMSVYDKYFTHNELEQMPLYTGHTLKSAQWQERVAEVKSLTAKGVKPTSPQAQQVAARWMAALEQDTGGNPDFFCRLNKMHLSDNEFAASSGITAQMIEFVAESFSEYQLSLFKPHVTPQQFTFMQQHYFRAGAVWPDLIAGLYTAMKSGEDPASPAVRKLAQTWLVMFNTFTGGDPGLQEIVRRIYREEPAISKGTRMTPEIGQYLFTAIQAVLQE